MEHALERVAAFGGGREVVWQIPESAEIRLAEGQGHLLAGATITSWGEGGFS